MKRQVRKYTTALLEAVEEGLITAEDALRIALNYMSEADVEDMCQSADLADFILPTEDDNECA